MYDLEPSSYDTLIIPSFIELFGKPTACSFHGIHIDAILFPLPTLYYLSREVLRITNTLRGESDFIGSCYAYCKKYRPDERDFFFACLLLAPFSGDTSVRAIVAQIAARICGSCSLQTKRIRATAVFCKSMLWRVLQ